MDTLYIGEIPLDYHYAVFNDNYITLYNQPSGYNETLNYYRVYTTNNGFYYSTGHTDFGRYQTQYFTNINVSNDWIYRSDIDKIFVCCFIIFLMFIWLFNIVTSVFKKGGVFGGLF